MIWLILEAFVHQHLKYVEKLSHQKHLKMYIRVSRTDFGMGGDLSPPIGGGHMGGDKGPMGGDWRVIRDKIWRCLK